MTYPFSKHSKHKYTIQPKLPGGIDLLTHYTSASIFVGKSKCSAKWSVKWMNAPIPTNQIPPQILTGTPAHPPIPTHRVMKTKTNPNSNSNKISQNEIYSTSVKKDWDFKEDIRFKTISKAELTLSHIPKSIRDKHSFVDVEISELPGKRWVTEGPLKLFMCTECGLCMKVCGEWVLKEERVLREEPRINYQVIQEHQLMYGMYIIYLLEEGKVHNLPYKIDTSTLRGMSNLMNVLHKEGKEGSDKELEGILRNIPCKEGELSFREAIKFSGVPYIQRYLGDIEEWRSHNWEIHKTGLHGRCLKCSQEIVINTSLTYIHSKKWDSHIKKQIKENHGRHVGSDTYRDIPYEDWCSVEMFNWEGSSINRPIQGLPSLENNLTECSVYMMNKALK